jgi:hypothetical protein
MIEGSGSGSMPLTNGSGSMRPKNIRIRNTGKTLLFRFQEGVVKLDHSGDVKMLQLKYLCKMKSDD